MGGSAKAQDLLLATGNPGKLLEFRQILDGLPYRLLSLKDAGIATEVAETGDTFEENAVIKARDYCGQSCMLTLADDSGLVVDALGGRPGVRSARYGGAGLSDEDRVRLVLSQLANVPWQQRTARFQCVIALAWPSGAVRTVVGAVEGVIQYEPEGCNGFGYDPIFRLPDRGSAMAQLSPVEKNRISHRGEAARKAAALLLESGP